MLPFVTPAVIAGATALIGRYFQKNRVKAEEKMIQRKAQIAEANRIFEKLSKEMSERNVLMMDVFWSYTHSDKLNSGTIIKKKDAKKKEDLEDEREKRWDAYQEILIRWNTDLPLFLVQTKRYFGVAMYHELLKIQAQFVKMHNIFHAIMHDEIPEPDIGYKDRLIEMIHAFNSEMIRHIQEEEVGTLHPEYQKKGSAKK